VTGSSRAALVAAGLLALGACQRRTASSPPPVAPQAQLRAGSEPLDAKRLRGAEALGSSVVLTVEAGIAGDRITTLLEVPAESCAVAIARGSSTVQDLDLLAYGEDGAALGSDEAADREPALLICPPHPGRVLLVARIAQGHGIVAVGTERVSPALAAKAAERYRVKAREPGEGPRLKAFPGLDALVLRERARVGGKFQDLRRVALLLDSGVPTTLPATIEGGRCVHGLFVPSGDVSHLDVAALDDGGRVLGRAVGSGRTRALLVCSPDTTDIAFEIRPHAGRGLAVAALSQTVPGTESELVGERIRRDVYPSAPMASELARLDSELSRLGYRPSGSSAANVQQLRVGARSSRALTLADGCTRVDLVAAAPLRGLSARLWSDAGELRAEATAGGALTLFACGAGRMRLDAAAQLAAGPVAVVLSHEPDAPAGLGRLPLAGGRLISRMFARGVLKRADAIGKVTELALSATQLTLSQVMVPVDRCVDVNVGVQGPSAGVELRAIDADTQQELYASVDAAAASARLCAFGRGALGSLNVRIELRAVSATAQALLATRLLSPAD
jgi:hypothetical protein